MNPFGIAAASPLWAQPVLAIVAEVVVMGAFLLIAVAIVIDFRNYHRQSKNVVSSDRSLVETGSMTAFFVAYYLVIRFRVLETGLGGPVREVLIVTGLALIAIGVVFNIWGRLRLKSSWANQIRIYEGQRLLTSGPYSVVRHPLYASLIWIFVGGSMIYANPVSLALTLAVFVPMMLVRGRKEDALLLQNFSGEYEAYRSRTGMFFPKLRRSPWRT